MVKYLRKILAIVMVFTLCVGLVTYASAEEIAVLTTAEAVPEEGTESSADDGTEETIPPEELDSPDSDDRILDTDTYASTQNSIMLFDFADNGDYTTRLNYQVSCAYKPNGSGTTRTAYVKTWAGILQDTAALPMRTNRCTALSLGAIMRPAQAAIPWTGM